MARAETANSCATPVSGAQIARFGVIVGKAAAKETITVSESAHMVETNPTAVSALVDDRAITDLPLNGLTALGVTSEIARMNDIERAQVLVWQDAFGLRGGRMARFVKQ